MTKTAPRPLYMSGSIYTCEFSYYFTHETRKYEQSCTMDRDNCDYCEIVIVVKSKFRKQSDLTFEWGARFRKQNNFIFCWVKSSVCDTTFLKTII